MNKAKLYKLIMCIMPVLMIVCLIGIVISHTQGSGAGETDIITEEAQRESRLTDLSETGSDVSDASQQSGLSADPDNLEDVVTPGVITVSEEEADEMGFEIIY